MFRQKDYVHLAIPHAGELTTSDFTRFYDNIYVRGENLDENARIAEEILREFPRVCFGIDGEIEFRNSHLVRIRIFGVRNSTQKLANATTIEGPPEVAIPLLILSEAEMAHPSDPLHRFIPPKGWETRFARSCCAVFVSGGMAARVRIHARNVAEVLLRGRGQDADLYANLRIPSEHSAIHCVLGAAHDLLAARVIWYGQHAIYRLEQYGMIVETGIHAVDELIRATRAVLVGR